MGPGIADEGVVRAVVLLLRDFDNEEGPEVWAGDLVMSRVEALRDGGAMKRAGAGSRWLWLGILLDEEGIVSAGRMILSRTGRTIDCCKVNLV